jgi:guanylate kinase
MVVQKLEKYDAFKTALMSYKPSIDVIDVLSDSPVVLLVAPAGAGRNTIIRNLIMTDKYHFVVSDTTRKQRINNGVPERDGEEYWFKSEEQVLKGLEQGEYVEAAIIHEQQVSGANMSEYKLAGEKGQIAITDIEINGCETMRQYASKITCVFVLPPDFDEWMRRLDARGVMDADEKTRRLQSAVYEIETALTLAYFKYVINWDLRQTSLELHEQIMSSIFDESMQLKAHDHAAKLLESLRTTLGS